ncbi:MAG: transcription antitermination factor NusB [Butyricicoccaceae bacterium]
MKTENLNERLDENIMQLASEPMPQMYAGRLSGENRPRYIRAVVKGVATDLDELDGAIERNAKGWKLNRLSRMTKAVLRLAIYEMRYVRRRSGRRCHQRGGRARRRSTTPRRLLPSSTACSALRPRASSQGKQDEHRCLSAFWESIRPITARRRRFTTPRPASGCNRGGSADRAGRRDRSAPVGRAVPAYRASA